MSDLYQHVIRYSKLHFTKFVQRYCKLAISTIISPSRQPQSCMADAVRIRLGSCSHRLEATGVNSFATTSHQHAHKHEQLTRSSHWIAIHPNRVTGLQQFHTHANIIYLLPPANPSHNHSNLPIFPLPLPIHPFIPTLPKPFPSTPTRDALLPPRTPPSYNPGPRPRPQRPRLLQHRCRNILWSRVRRGVVGLGGSHLRPRGYMPVA